MFRKVFANYVRFLICMILYNTVLFYTSAFLHNTNSNYNNF